MRLLEERKNNLKDALKYLSYVKGCERKIAIDLDDLVDEYIKWYTKNVVVGSYTKVGEYNEPKRMRNFIEKVAVWYELRYPDYEINRLFPGSSQEIKNISEEMFNKNPYVDTQMDENSDTRILDWQDFYNTKSFIHSLPREEMFYFDRPRYPNIIYWDSSSSFAHLHLTSNGFIDEIEGAMPFNSKSFKGKHIKTLLNMLDSKNILFPNREGIENIIQKFEAKIIQKEGMLDAIMYRIITRGGNRMGARRGLLFAKEFGRNINIPMKYGVDLSDPGLREFVNEFLKLGGQTDLDCYIGYHNRNSKNERLYTITIQDILKLKGYDYKETYTKEEQGLHKDLINVLKSQIDLTQEYENMPLRRVLEKRKNTD